MKKVMITFNDKTQTITKWADEIGISPRTLWARLRVHKIPLELALIPGDTRNIKHSRKNYQFVVYNGVKMGLVDACNIAGISYSRYRQRKSRHKLTPQQAFDHFVITKR